ncbi:heme exporter protein CcmD [Candidatus Poriferisocius sp.]
MTHVGYIAAGWSVTVVAVVAYAGWMLLRGRRLSRRVPENRRRWMMPDD